MFEQLKSEIELVRTMDEDWEYERLHNGALNISSKVRKLSLIPNVPEVVSKLESLFGCKVKLSDAFNGVNISIEFKAF